MKDHGKICKKIKIIVVQKFSMIWLEAEACGGKSQLACLCVCMRVCGGTLKILIRLISGPYGPPLLYLSNSILTVPLSLSSWLCVCVLCVCVCGGLCECLTNLVWDHSSTLRLIYKINSVLAEEFEYWTREKNKFWDVFKLSLQLHVLLFNL